MNTAKKRILVVDHETSFTRLLKLNLERTGEYATFELKTDPPGRYHRHWSFTLI